MLVANKRARGKRKVANRWESTVYTVIEKNSQTHTFKICDTLTGRERILHRNLLLLVNFLPIQGDLSDFVSSPVVSAGASVNSGDCDSEGVFEPHIQVGTSSFQGDVQDNLSHIPAVQSDASDASVPVMTSTASAGDSAVLLPNPCQSDSVSRTTTWDTQLPDSEHHSTTHDTDSTGPVVDEASLVDSVHNFATGCTTWKEGHHVGAGERRVERVTLD